MAVLFLAGTVLAVALGPARAPEPVAADTLQAAVWRIDPTNSELLFRVRHLVSRVAGTFTDWEGVITGAPPDWDGGRVEVRVRTRSIDTNNERRDRHLRSPDFFASDSFPEMSFRSTGVEFAGSALVLRGDLTIRGITRSIVLTGSYLGMTAGPGGRDRVGFAVAGTIKRLDYGLTWNRAAEGGGLVLGDEVAIEVTVAAEKVPPGATLGPAPGPGA
ncbi:MAG TPA: YceI family protein [Gemmatimonadales bacterium]|jgi:polyisoprenoid-binding protein YceI|nr:YceI family protein [Gemmatimonadales bacterium]